MIDAVKPSSYAQKLQLDSHDLEQLKIFTQDQTAVRLYIDKDGHLWTQKIDVNLVIQIIQYLARVFHEMSFPTADDRVNFLVNNTELMLREIIQSAKVIGHPAAELEAFQKTFNKNSFKDELELLTKSRAKVMEIMENKSLSATDRMDAFSKIQLISNLSGLFLQAKSLLLISAAASPVIAEVATSPQPAIVNPIVEELPAEAVEIVSEVAPLVIVRKPKIDHFTQWKKLAVDLFLSDPNATAMLRVKLDRAVVKPTAVNKEVLKGLLAGTEKYISLTVSETKRDLAATFYQEMTIKIGHMDGVTKPVEPASPIELGDGSFYDVEL
jgi:hypothetical protein